MHGLRTQIRRHGAGRGRAGRQFSRLCQPVRPRRSRQGLVERGAFARSLKRARHGRHPHALPARSGRADRHLDGNPRGQRAACSCAAGWRSDVARGREVLSLMRQGALDGLSIGFRTVKARQRRADRRAPHPGGGSLGDFRRDLPDAARRPRRDGEGQAHGAAIDGGDRARAGQAAPA